MTSPDDALRKIVEEAIAPRLAGHAIYMATARPDALPIARAELLYLWDDYRAEYLDWATAGHPVGHSHPMVRSQVSEQLAYYGHTAPTGHHIHRWPVEYAQAISGQFPVPGENPRQVLWTEGEREAVRTALRLSDDLGKRAAVLDTGWHEWLLAESYGADIWARSDIGDIPWESTRALLLATVDSRHCPVPAPDLRALILAAREYQVPVIIDETVTGFGRTGALWGQEHTGLMADVTVLGGGVGGGYPLGAVVADPPYFAEKSLDVSGQAGNPVACAAGAATLVAVTTGVLEYMSQSAPLLASGLDEIVTQFPAVLAGHHGIGMLRGLRFHDPARASLFPVEARAHGLYLAPAVGDTVLLAPALITSTNELTRGVDMLAATLMA